MRKEIFESKKHVEEFYKDLYENDHEEVVANFVSTVKEKGYIKQSELEKARLIREEIKHSPNIHFATFEEIFQHMENHIELLQTKYDEIKAYHQKFD